MVCYMCVTDFPACTYNVAWGVQVALLTHFATTTSVNPKKKKEERWNNNNKKKKKKKKREGRKE